MSFYNINSFQYTSLSINSVSLQNLLLNKLEIEENIQYKLNVIKEKEIESSSLHLLSLEENVYKVSSLKHPNVALSIPLQQGTYKIILKSFGIYNKNTNNFNDCIKSSKGKVTVSDFDFINENNKFDENGNINYSNVKNKNITEFEFKISRNSQFSIWIESNDKNLLIGNFEFYIVKVNKENIKKTVNSFLFSKSSYNQLNISFENNFIYLIEIYKLINDDTIFQPKPKYPEGTYQVVLNSQLISTINENLINSTKNADKSKYSLSFGKLKNLNNILIPYNLNPINYYYMIGKIEFLLYFDFITDTYYFQPISFAECFMALYIPKSSCKLIEKNVDKTYSIFKITYFTLIYHNFNNEEQIKNNLKNWLQITDDKINVDEYKLYYWIDLQNLDYSTYYNIVNQITDIESYYVYINLSIIGKIYDDVSLPISEDDILYWDVIDIEFNVLPKKSDKFNHINWNINGDWKNKDNIQNLLYTEISGEGIIKITKQHFKNATNIDLDQYSSNQNNHLTKEQLIKLNINEPNLSPYNRFQYWLRSDKF